MRVTSCWACSSSASATRVLPWLRFQSAARCPRWRSFALPSFFPELLQLLQIGLLPCPQLQIGHDFTLGILQPRLRNHYLLLRLLR